MDSKKELELLFKKDFPIQPLETFTFLDVIKQQRKENTISNIYAHFLDSYKSPLLSELFLDALIQLINEKSSKEIQLINYSVFTEYSTYNNAGRIDLVIESNQSKSVIIIENKVDFWLHNDLDNYWETFEKYDDQNKVGIVLCLTPLAHQHPKFITITHLEWIMKIEELGIPNSIPLREQVYLEDFIINIKYITKNISMTENIKFYLENSEKIEQALQFKQEANDYVTEAINTVANKYQWSVYGNSSQYKQIWDKKNDDRVFFTLFPDELLKKRELKIVIEIEQKAREHYEALIKQLNSISFFTPGFIQGNFKTNFRAHIGYTVYSEITDEDLNNLDKFIISKIDNELEYKRQQIKEVLTNLGYK